MRDVTDILLDIARDSLGEQATTQTEPHVPDDAGRLLNEDVFHDVSDVEIRLPGEVGEGYVLRYHCATNYIAAYIALEFNDLGADVDKTGLVVEVPLSREWFRSTFVPAILSWVEAEQMAVARAGEYVALFPSPHIPKSEEEIRLFDRAMNSDAPEVVAIGINRSPPANAVFHLALDGMDRTFAHEIGVGIGVFVETEWHKWGEGKWIPHRFHISNVHFLDEMLDWHIEDFVNDPDEQASVLNLLWYGFCSERFRHPVFM